CVVGLIPESGPHMVFVSLYAEGVIPFSTLLASCIVQDGHGMIPMLAHSRRAFLGVKLINFIVGLAIGLVGLLLGW
ncbi:MAG: putative manganese transporter, partial [Kiritimatiellia bacterium]|nr:putative manganese transporter [Kiritimatiellia bacterium]